MLNLCKSILRICPGDRDLPARMICDGELQSGSEPWVGVDHCGQIRTRGGQKGSYSSKRRG